MKKKILLVYGLRKNKRKKIGFCKGKLKTGFFQIIFFFIYCILFTNNFYSNNYNFV